jgi:SNF2 family DNA or RNA helicase
MNSAARNPSGGAEGPERPDQGWSSLPVDWTLAGLPVTVRVGLPPSTAASSDLDAVRLRLEHARLRLLRDFEELLCLEGLDQVEHLPHQVETVRKVLRHFRGRVLLADEVGLGKTIEACLLLREYLLRGLARRVLILVPAALVSQWQEELASKFHLEFACAESASNLEADFWQRHDLVLASISLAKGRRHFDLVTSCPWDLVVVDEAHHCKNRATRNWQLVNSLQRRFLFLLTATPVQNDLLELYNLLTLLEPGHLRTESDFKKTYVRRGNPRDPRNRQRLRLLMGEVMVRNTRAMVSLNLPPRYAQTFVVTPDPEEADLYRQLDACLRRQCRGRPDLVAEAGDAADGPPGPAENGPPLAKPDLFPPPPPSPAPPPPRVSRMRLNALLMAAESHPAALLSGLEAMARLDSQFGPIAQKVRDLGTSAKEAKLLELLSGNLQAKTLVFAGFQATLDVLGSLLQKAGIPHVVFSGRRTAAEKAQAIAAFRDSVPVMLCSESGGEGHNLQFANTMVNFDLPWNPMRIEQRVGRIHRIGQTREVFIFNLCTAGSLDQRILRLLQDKIRMFELVVGEVGSILGNLEGGDEFESLVMNLWLHSRDSADLDQAFERLGDSLLAAQREYLTSKQLDEALFGDEYE